MRYAIFCIFFFTDTATTEIYTLSLHDALPIYRLRRQNVGYSNFSQPQSHLSFCVLLQYLVEAKRKRSEERFSRNAETDLVCRLLLEKKKKYKPVHLTLPHLIADGSVPQASQHQ